MTARTAIDLTPGTARAALKGTLSLAVPVRPQPRSRDGVMPADAEALQHGPGPDGRDFGHIWSIRSRGLGVRQYESSVPGASADSVEYWRQACPWGPVGSVLKGREIWASISKDIVAYDADASCGAWVWESDLCGLEESRRVFWRHGVVIPASGYATAEFPASSFGLAMYGGKWLAPRSMPDEYVRIYLRIDRVAVEHTGLWSWRLNLSRVTPEGEPWTASTTS